MTGLSIFALIERALPAASIIAVALGSAGAAWSYIHTRKRYYEEFKKRRHRDS